MVIILFLLNEIFNKREDKYNITLSNEMCFKVIAHNNAYIFYHLGTDRACF